MVMLNQISEMKDGSCGRRSFSSTLKKNGKRLGGGNLLWHSTKGIYGLKKCHDVADAVADIVFVHGLTGNRETTWTDKTTGVFWPLHLLKTDIPKTRIVTFGYDADIAHFWAPASQNCIRNHAINLANAIAQLRERTETENRPIIFVTHSLGGLVLEDAMLASRNSPEPHLQNIYDTTVGVCFLGTPHCGSTLANWGAVFGQIANTVKKINTNLLKVLEPESEVLAIIQGDFHAMLRSRSDQGRPSLSITCFYEELPVKGVGEIVPKHSAILPVYNSIGIRANHMDMARFSDKEDQGYLSVSTELLRWVRAIQKAQGVKATSSPALAIPPNILYPPGSQGHYQYPPGYNPYYQQAQSPVHPVQQAGPPPEWQQSPRLLPTSSSPPESQGGNVISGSINGNRGTIFQGTFSGPVTL
ncbi:Alpha/Beta hydrolase protein [Lasiosphaeria hispida]|uniref:Alpha/Beta hydrolase protein n=1 Tax=Lasiosphaeria hispida TaxID=260671 RepID=A0AAJ0MH22_9PEZI|nr:Alpha/Beta hydrolase protein [Lasiosphaeria hispida]